MHPTPAGEQPGWVNTAADTERAVASYRRDTLGSESFESVTKDGRSYRIFAGSRLGVVPHRDGLVTRFCFDFDDHGGDGGNLHLADALDRFLGAQAIRFTSRRGKGLHCFYAIDPLPVGDFVPWVKAWGFNRQDDIECFPKTDLRSQVWLPNEPNDDGGDAYVSGTLESCVVRQIPPMLHCRLRKDTRDFLRGFVTRMRNVELNKAVFDCAQRGMPEAEARPLCMRGAELCGLLAEKPGETETTFVSAFRSGNARARPEMVRGTREDFRRITARELATTKYELEYLVEGVLVKDQPAGLVGPKKALKTNIGIDLSVSLAIGGNFLGYFRVPKPRRVAIFSGESGLATIQETALRVSLASGYRLEDTEIIFSDTLPRFGDWVNMTAFRRFLERDHIEVVILDPAYLCFPGDINTANLFEVGRLLVGVNEVCRDVGATLVLAHHLKKTVTNPYAPGQLEDISWAGFQEYFRQWVMVNRREPYEPGSGMHRLWLSTGGSAGHSCQVGLDIYEGVRDPEGLVPRVWQVSVCKTSDVMRDAADRREQAREGAVVCKANVRLERDKQKLLNVLKEHLDGETFTCLCNESGLNRQRAHEAIDTLMDEGSVTTCEITKGKTKRARPGFRLVSDATTDDEAA